jgi:uncharacterized protein (DUF779 family)
VHEVDSTAFVDDLLNSLKVIFHASCNGLDGRCPVCLEALGAARHKMAFLDKMMKDCGLEYSVKGDMSIRQRHLYIGVIFDTLKGRLHIGKEKFDKLMQLLAELMQQVEALARLMSKLRGKMGHQSACMSGFSPLLVPSNQFCGRARDNGGVGQSEAHPTQPSSHDGHFLQLAPEPAGTGGRDVAP